jgi:hypothetical protein
MFLPEQVILIWAFVMRERAFGRARYHAYPSRPDKSRAPFMFCTLNVSKRATIMPG